jgi:hypothetical protein
LVVVLGPVLAALVVLEERGFPEALIDAVSAGREERAYVILVCYFKCRNILLERANTRNGT